VAGSPLLATKLHVPRQRTTLVRRPRLANRLFEASLPALTLVSAPPGFGKTTVLTEWFERPGGSRFAWAWVSLDAGDNDPTRFWSYVLAALQAVAPEVGETSLLQLLTSQSLPAVVGALVNALADISGDVVLVLDDYHVIESRDVHESVTFLIEHIPRQLHVVLASRADPPLPLARLRARGELLEIRAADLRFTTDEATAYFNETMGLDLDAGDVSALEARTEGWIAAMQLASLSMQGRDEIGAFIEKFTGNDRFVVDYLADEVLDRQTEAVRDFLLRTSILDRLTGPLCDAVTGRAGGAATLAMLDRANLFLVPLDDERRWYRYHHLFADVIRARQQAEQPDAISELHRRATEWYDTNGDRPEAIRHAIAGRDFECAAKLIELAEPGMRTTRQEVTLRRWLEALPEDVFRDRPVLSIILVGARMSTGDAAGVEPLLGNIERWLGAPAAPHVEDARPIVFDHEEFARLPARVALYRAALALLAGDTVGTIAHAERVLVLIEPTDHLGRGSATAIIGLARWAVGDLDQARSRYVDAIESLLAADHISDALGCSLALADIQIALGRLGDAGRTFESALQHARQSGTLRGTADMHVGIAELLIRGNDLDEAARHLQISGELGELAGLPQHAYRQRVAAALLMQARGDLVGAQEQLDQAEPVYNTDFSPPVRPVSAMKARVQLAQGDIDAAVRWADDRRLTVEDELTYVGEFEHTTLARTLLARHAATGDNRAIESAQALLDRLLEAARRGERDGSVIELLTLVALAHHIQGRRSEAAAALEEALARAEPEGNVRVFIDVVPSLDRLLQTLSIPGAGGAHLTRVLIAAGESPVATSPRQGLVAELSAREHDVLRLLRTDMSGPEIARELLVSLNTMRTHTKSIYTKLGVTNRREAVRRAADLGI